MEKENVKIIIKGEEIGSGIIVDGFLIFDYEDKMIICELEESGNYGYIKSRRVIDKGIVDIDNITIIKKLFI